VRLGLTKEEFFSLMPRQFVCLQGVLRDRDSELQIMIGALRADLINYSFCRPKEPVRVADLMPWLSRKLPRRAGAPTGRKLNARLRRDIASSVRRLFADAEEA
jgi:hypothetical protein